MCVCVCVLVYMVYGFIYISKKKKKKNIYIYIYIYCVCLCVFWYIWFMVYIYILKNIYIYIYIYMCVCVCVCVCVCILRIIRRQVNKKILKTKYYSVIKNLKNYFWKKERISQKCLKLCSNWPKPTKTAIKWLKIIQTVLKGVSRCPFSTSWYDTLWS